ncbi:MAG: hypothetical protein WBD95_18825 [Xanthobacteraceae bacterium]
MTPEISEFSYGFALTNEIVGWAPVAAAPLFPSLIEEGKAGGGYDVRLDMSGVALYLQFKRADCMIRTNAREIQQYRLAISVPFYRFKITESGKSDQHEMLLALTETSNLVFYAAPRFHELAEIDEAWAINRVAARSIFVSPKEIGELDDDSHHIAYDDNRAWLCSDPKQINFHGSSGLIEQIERRLHEDPRPLRSKLREIVSEVEGAKERAVNKIRDRKGFELPPIETPRREEPRLSTPLRAPRALSEDEQLMRNLSDDAAKTFNAQLIVVQPRRA